MAWRHLGTKVTLVRPRGGAGELAVTGRRRHRSAFRSLTTDRARTEVGTKVKPPGPTGHQNSRGKRGRSVGTFAPSGRRAAGHRFAMEGMAQRTQFADLEALRSLIWRRCDVVGPRTCRLYRRE